MAVILDKNLVVLLVAGSVDRALIEAHKRLRYYEQSDYALFLTLLARSSATTLMPNVLTESSNLLAQISNPARQRLLVGLALLASQHTECYVQSTSAMQQADYLRLGLADAAILAAFNDGNELLTADAGLHNAAIRRGHGSRNFFQEKDYVSRKQ